LCFVIFSVTICLVIYICLINARLGELFWGVLPGDTAMQKQQAFQQLNTDSLQDLIQKAGFIVKMDQGAACLFPSGFMMAYIATDDCMGLRWGVSGDQSDNSRVLNTLKFWTRAFPELQQPRTGNNQFIDFVTRSM